MVTELDLPDLKEYQNWHPPQRAPFQSGHSETPRPSLLLEQRAGFELAELFTSPVYHGSGVPRGNGSQHVLLLAGFMGSDGYLSIPEEWLRRMGYKPHLSGLGVMAGSFRRLLDRVEQRTEELADRYGKLTLVGHSLGGVFAKVTAVRRPDLVSHVVALGSPLTGNPCESAYPIVRSLGQMLIVDERNAMQDLASPLPKCVHLTSIYTREDAVIDYRACLDKDPNATCIEVRGSHSGLAWNSQVYGHLARALA